MERKFLLTVGGFDPRGRLGVTADRACLLAQKFDPVTLVSGVFLQPDEIEPVGAAVLERQLRVFVDKRQVSCVKTGLLGSRENIETTAMVFEDQNKHFDNFVVDAYIEGENESPFLSSSAISILKMRLLPLSLLVIVYLSEAERLSGIPVNTIDQMKEAAEAIHIFGPKFVLVRADHIIENELVDIFYDGSEHRFLFAKTVPDANPRTSRDLFASALAANLASGRRVQEAVESARKMQSDGFGVGRELSAR